MKILQFGFGSDSANPFLPFNYSPNCIVYTGTHDNDTTVNWFNLSPEHEKQNLLLFLGCQSPEGIHWDLIRLAMTCVANQAIIPLQDVLGLGGEARMNFPSKAEGNWEWCYQGDSLTKELSDRLQTLTRLCGRAPQSK